ncbi:hypothetical protein [Shewanella sp. UCD-KL12]|uniref:hypothetical protein n=1 Tax=Shewanella sp. UCD-KL12 TaxID=1917163 RepID=UPI00097133DD|nr:hypothetical protein [Shewanella sp. UCD-KL12]
MKWSVAIKLTFAVLLTVIISKAIAYPSFDIESQDTQQDLVCNYDCHNEVEVIVQDEIVADSLRNQFGVR